MNKILPWHQPLVESTVLSAATLLVGDTGRGVNELAMQFAHRLIDAEHSHIMTEPDIMLVEHENEKIKIEAISEVIHFLSFAPIKREKKIVVIQQAEYMNLAACNMLLKTLEEPGGNKYIILSTRSLRLLPAPIVSRCHLIHVPVPTLSEVKSFFNQGDAQLIAFCTNQPLLMEVLPTAWPEQMAKIFLQGKKIDIGAAVTFFSDKKSPVNGWFDGLQKWVVDAIRTSCNGEVIYFSSYKKELHGLSKNNKQQWMNFYQHLLIRKQWINHPLNKDLFIREILYDYRQLCSY